MNSNYYGNYWRTLFRGSDVNHLLIVSQSNDDLGYYDNASGFQDSGYSMASYVGAQAWHQITVVANAGSSTYYIDGNRVSSPSLT